MGVLRNDEIGEGQIAEDEFLFPDELLEFFEFGEVLRDGLSLYGFVVLVEEQSAHCPSDFVEDRKEAFEFGVVVVILSQELSLAPSFDDVPLNGLRLGDVVLSVDKVGEVGEVEPERLLVSFEPLIPVSVVVVLEVDSGVG